MTFLDTSSIKPIEPVPGFKGRVVHGSSMTVVFWEVAAGSVMPEHSHPHEQVANVVDGTFELTISGETRQMKPGETAVIDPNEPHSGRALTDCRLIDVFQPVRMDLR
ncbi:cupin domain-containing protein [bacterium]|nr:cupin domain-containing protein [bacterium]